MNMNQIINMLTRMFTNKAANWAIKKGTGHLGKSATSADPAARPSKSQRDQEKQARQAAKRARQALRITKRLGR